MKKISRTLLLALVAVMLSCSMSVSAFAADSKSNAQKVSSTLHKENVYVAKGTRPQVVRAQKGIYDDIETLIYTGKGCDRWLHISPWLAPNSFVIKMVDYHGDTVWNQSFWATGVTHWFVGSNVKYVYLSGFPGGAVDVTDTAN